MAVNVTVFDLVNFPNNPKTVTVDITELVPLGNAGEDTWVLSAITSATASGGAAIQRLYISDTSFGWAKSNNLNSGPFDVTDSQKHLKVAIDEDIASAVEIELATSAQQIGGNAVADDMQTKLGDTARTGGGKVGNLAYLNATVTFVDGVFQIISGSAAGSFTGATRSSVDVADGASTTGLSAELGFDILVTSETLAAAPPTQTSLSANYTSGTSITIANSGFITGGDCIAVSDGTNTEFRGIESGVGTVVTLSSGLANSYVSGSVIQVLTQQDPAGVPVSALTTVDDYVKFSIASLTNQIDFS